MGTSEWFITVVLNGFKQCVPTERLVTQIATGWYQCSVDSFMRPQNLRKFLVTLEESEWLSLKLVTQ